MLALLLGVSILGAGLVLDMAFDDDNEDTPDQDNDTVEETGGEDTSGDLIDIALSGNGALYLGNEQNERISGTNGSDSIDGAAGDDILNGMVGGDLLLAGEGNDTVYGGGGNDLIGTSAGNDRLFGDEGDDLIIDEDDVADSGDDFIRGGDGNDTLASDDGTDELRGDLGNDLLFALDIDPDEASPDTLIGGFGNDTLLGDEGDVLTGGDGTDVFGVLFPSNDAGPATITDFDALTETIEIETQCQFGTGAEVTFSPTDDGTGTIVSVAGTDFVVVENTTPDMLILGTNITVFGI
jgi:Ca2+-binding RTX toxin-like protein